MSLGPAILLGLLAVPFVSSERPVTTALPGPWGGLIGSNSEAPPIGTVFDGSNHVVVWTDHRASALMAARVSPAGDVLDPAGLVLRAAATPGIIGGWAAIAFDGSQHLVAFAQAATQGGYVGSEIVVLRLSRDLRVLDPAPIVVSTQPLSRYPAVSFDGTQFVVAWSAGTMASASNADTSRHVARIAANGTVLDPGGRALETGMRPGYAPGRLAAVSAQGVTALVWQSVRLTAQMMPEYSAKVRRLRADGTWVDAAPLEIGSPSRYAVLPAVATDGQRFLLAWNEGRFTTSVSVTALATRLETSGPPLDVPALVLQTGGNELLRAGPGLGWAGSEWHAVYSIIGQASRGRRISSAGAVLPPVVLPVVEGASYPVLGWSGQDQLWLSASYEAGGHLFARGLRLDVEMNALDLRPIEVSLAAPAQARSAIASSGSGALAVWLEHRGGWPASVRGARLDTDGVSLDLDGFDVAVGAYEGGGFEVLAASWNGTDYVVAWSDRGRGGNTRDDVYAARVSPAGLVREPTGIPVAVAAGSQYDISIASLDSGTSLICWRRSAPGIVACSRLDASGGVLDANGGRDVSPQNAAAVGVAAIGQAFFVAWTTPASGAPGELWIRSFDPTSAALGAPVRVSTEAHWPSRPSFAGGPSEGQLVFSRASAGLVRSAVLAVTVSAAGAVSGSEVVSPAGTGHDVARSGDEWLITWSEQGNPLSDSRLMARRRSVVDGSFLEAAFEVASGHPVSRLAVAANDSGWISAYERFIPAADVNNVRVRARLIDDRPRDRPDAGVADAEPSDGGELDAGASDAGTGDAGLDAGTEVPDGGAGGLTFVSAPNREAECDALYTYRPEAAGAGPVSYALAVRPAGMNIAEGTVRWTPSRSQTGQAAVEILASDGQETVRQLYTIEVRCEAGTLVADECSCRAASRGSPSRHAGWLLFALLALRRPVRRMRASS